MEATYPRYACIVVAAGKGTRFGASLPKQFSDLGGRPVLMTTIERLRKALPPTSEICLVLSADFIAYWQELCAHHGFESPRIVEGGDTRWQSVKNALMAIDAEGFDRVFVHDGARPLTEPQVVDRLVAALDGGAQGAIPGIDLTDSIRRLSADRLSSQTVDRADYKAVQTPQIFDFRLLREAYNRPFDSSMTDDASVMEHAGFNHIELVEGSQRTLKITHPIDLLMVEYWIRQSN